MKLISKYFLIEISLLFHEFVPKLDKIPVFQFRTHGRGTLKKISDLTKP
jgi:hypothetical protein